MKLMPKTNFMKLHFFIALFTLLSILTGLFIYYGLITGYTIRSIHFYAGLMIAAAPLIVYALMKKRYQLLNAFKTLALVNRMDLKRKRYLSITGKLLLLVFMLGLLKQMITGILIGLKVFNTPDAVNALYALHTAGVPLFPVLLVLHAATMFLAKRALRPQSAKQNINA